MAANGRLGSDDRQLPVRMTAFGATNELPSDRELRIVSNTLSADWTSRRLTTQRVARPLEPKRYRECETASRVSGERKPSLGAQHGGQTRGRPSDDSRSCAAGRPLDNFSQKLDLTAPGLGLPVILFEVSFRDRRDHPGSSPPVRCGDLPLFEQRQHLVDRAHQQAQQARALGANSQRTRTGNFLRALQGI
jgi:hypothetical protein